MIYSLRWLEYFIDSSLLLFLVLTEMSKLVSERRLNNRLLWVILSIVIILRTYFSHVPGIVCQLFYVLVCKIDVWNYWLMFGRRCCSWRCDGIVEVLPFVNLIINSWVVVGVSLHYYWFFCVLWVWLFFAYFWFLNLCEVIKFYSEWFFVHFWLFTVQLN